MQFATFLGHQRAVKAFGRLSELDDKWSDCRSSCRSVRDSSNRSEGEELGKKGTENILHPKRNEFPTSSPISIGRSSKSELRTHNKRPGEYCGHFFVCLLIIMKSSVASLTIFSVVCSSFQKRFDFRFWERFPSVGRSQTLMTRR